jgi:hypothetical protein
MHCLLVESFQIPCTDVLSSLSVNICPWLATKECPVFPSERAPRENTTGAVRVGVIFVHESRKRLDTKTYRLSARRECESEKHNGGFHTGSLCMRFARCTAVSSST